MTDFRNNSSSGQSAGHPMGVRFYGRRNRHYQRLMSVSIRRASQVGLTWPPECLRSGSLYNSVQAGQQNGGLRGACLSLN